MGLCTSPMVVSLRRSGRGGRQLDLEQEDSIPSGMDCSTRRMNGSTVMVWTEDSGQRCARKSNQQVSSDVTLQLHNTCIHHHMW